MDTIRVGIVGAGRNTTVMHIPKLQAIDGVEIVSVANRSRESSQRVAAQFGIPTVYERWQELVAAPDTDAIIIGTWPYLHCEATQCSTAERGGASEPPSAASGRRERDLVPSRMSAAPAQHVGGLQ